MCHLVNLALPHKRSQPPPSCSSPPPCCWPPPVVEHLKLTLWASQSPLSLAVGSGLPRRSLGKNLWKLKLHFHWAFLYNIAATLPDHKIPQEGVESDSPSNSSLLNLWSTRPILKQTLCSRAPELENSTGKYLTKSLTKHVPNTMNWDLRPLLFRRRRRGVFGLFWPFLTKWGDLLDLS